MKPKAMAALAAAILLAACSAPSPSAAPNSTATPSATGSAPAASSSPPSGSDVQPSPTQVPNPPSGSCPSERTTIAIHQGDPMTIDRCVHEGTQIDLTFQASAGYQWSTVDSSDHSRCTVTGNRIDPYGTGHATLRAVKRGDVVITASLSPIDRDQPSREWQLHLRIAASPLPLG